MDYANTQRDDLRKLARAAGVANVQKLTKAELITALQMAADADFGARNDEPTNVVAVDQSVADRLGLEPEGADLIVEQIGALNDFISEPVAPVAKPAKGKRAAGLDRVIEVNVANPKREGSQAYARFNLYRSGMTVGQFYAAGGKSIDVSWDEAHGFIKVR